LGGIARQPSRAGPRLDRAGGEDGCLQRAERGPRAASYLGEGALGENAGENGSAVDGARASRASGGWGRRGRAKGGNAHQQAGFPAGAVADDDELATDLSHGGSGRWRSRKAKSGAEKRRRGVAAGGRIGGGLMQADGRELRMDGVEAVVGEKRERELGSGGQGVETTRRCTEAGLALDGHCSGTGLHAPAPRPKLNAAPTDTRKQGHGSAGSGQRAPARPSERGCCSCSLLMLCAAADRGRSGGRRSSCCFLALL